MFKKEKKITFAGSIKKIAMCMARTFDAPFVFGVRVEGDVFTDRREETERLKMNFLYGVNTILISPRRMGKTSLVDKVCALVANEETKIARMDAFGCR